MRRRKTLACAITDKLLDFIVLISDLDDHPLSEHSKKVLELDSLKQVDQGGITRCLEQLKIQCRGRRLVMPPCKMVEIRGAEATTQDIH